MVEIYKGLFVGTTTDYEYEKSNEDFFVVIAAKEPYHRLAVGYKGRSCDKDNPEYLFAERGRCLICNLIDVADPTWISPIIISKALDFISTALKLGKQVLICCNQGQSRSAVIGLLYLKKIGIFKGIEFQEAERRYCDIYPNYSPADGMRKFAIQYWDRLEEQEREI